MCVDFFFFFFFFLCHSIEISIGADLWNACFFHQCKGKSMTYLEMDIICSKFFLFLKYSSHPMIAFVCLFFRFTQYPIVCNIAVFKLTSPDVEAIVFSSIISRASAKDIHCAQNVKPVRLCTEFYKCINNIFLICHILWHFQDGHH